MMQIGALDLYPAEALDRWRLLFGQPKVLEDELLLPFCGIKKFYLPYYAGINEKKLSKIIFNLQQNNEGMPLLLSRRAKDTGAAAFAPFRMNHAAFLRGICVQAVRRVARACKVSPDKMSIYLKTDSSPREVLPTLLALSGEAKDVYLCAGSDEGLEEVLTQVFEETGASVIASGTPDVQATFCIAVVLHGLEEFLQSLPEGARLVVLNFTGEPTPQGFSFPMADGVVLSAKVYALLKSKGIDETEVVQALSIPPEQLEVEGFTRHGEPVHLPRVQNG